ncbi:hypothetical protein B5C34_13830 [Pacificimonas flava]|uniref:Type-4 uracil-DNA glycosylase n=2 Tax=Pacificimonas TaxID=1960290 RepID=A0A219B7R8_9SPHN|nr:hypothetical protein B5C34_13830 [Pacificimonas flava]
MIDARTAAAALRWLSDSGADVLAADAAGNWLDAPVRLSAPRAVAPGMDTGSAAERGAGMPGAEAIPVVRADPRAEPPRPVRIDLKAKTLAELRAESETLEIAARRPRAPLVFADGNPDSGVMIVGEAPGAEEERQGRPFVGPAGQLLDRMLGAIGLDREQVYITNLSLWRPVGNRVPSAQEAAELLPVLHRHIALVKPRALLAVGGASAKALLETTSGIMRIRGRWQDIEADGHKVPVMPTFHPAYLLREPVQKRLAWRDLLAFSARIS